MITRRIPSPMLFVRKSPARWLRMLACAVDDAAEATELATARLCRNHWQHGTVAALQAVNVSRRTPLGFQE